jgi:pimeloyl-ACP methyl ester carboxylesterase
VTLMDDLGNDHGYPARMKIGAATGGLIGKSAAQLEALLSMEHLPGQEAPLKTSLEPGTNIRAGRAINAAYNQFVGSWNVFNYDWRADVRWNAGRLLQFLQTRTPAGQRWNLVGHSQGGLLIILASKLLADPPAFSNLVRSVTLVGSPLAGTFNSAHALIDGEQLGEANAPVFKRVVRTWPGIYQMLPSWDAVVDKNGQPVGQSILDPTTWAAHAGASADHLSRTLAVQQMLQNPLSKMDSGTTALILMATNRKTRTELLWKNNKLTAKAVSKEGGDTLVPFDHTLAWLGAANQGFVARVGSGNRQHSMLMNDSTVISLVNQQRS